MKKNQNSSLTEDKEQTFAGRLSTRRTDQEMTQEELAKCVGCEAQHISRIETGVRNCSISLLIELAVELNTSTDYLLGINMSAKEAAKNNLSRSDCSQEAFGKRLRSIRTDQGMTQEELAKCVGCEAQHISRIETGVRSCSFKLLIELAVKLNTSTDYLLIGNDPAREQESDEE